MEAKIHCCLSKNEHIGDKAKKNIENNNVFATARHKIKVRAKYRVANKGNQGQTKMPF